MSDIEKARERVAQLDVFTPYGPLVVQEVEALIRAVIAEERGKAQTCENSVTVLEGIVKCAFCDWTGDIRNIGEHYAANHLEGGDALSARLTDQPVSRRPAAFSPATGESATSGGDEPYVPCVMHFRELGHSEFVQEDTLIVWREIKPGISAGYTTDGRFVGMQWPLAERAYRAGLLCAAEIAEAFSRSMAGSEGERSLVRELAGSIRAEAKKDGAHA